MSNRITNAVISAPPRPLEFDVTGISVGSFEVNGAITAGQVSFVLSPDGVQFAPVSFFSFTQNKAVAALKAGFNGSERGAFDLAGKTTLRAVCSPDFAGTIDVCIGLHSAPTPDVKLAVG